MHFAGMLCTSLLASLSRARKGRSRAVWVVPSLKLLPQSLTWMNGCSTAISWVAFLLPPTELSNRCSISLTLILALNVFQLIINESTPKTDYLTPMHEFIITSTFMVVGVALESVLVHIAHRRVSVKGAVNAVFKDRVSRRSTAVPTMLRKHLRRARESLSDGETTQQALENEPQTIDASEDSQSKAPAFNPMFLAGARVYATPDVEEGLSPEAAGRDLSGASGIGESSVSDASLAENKNFRRQFSNLNLQARVDVLVAARADLLSLVFFPLVYIATMVYIFGSPHNE